MVREVAFDGRPSGWKVIVTFRQSPDAMEMIGEQHAGEHIEGTCPSGMDERVLK